MKRFCSIMGNALFFLLLLSFSKAQLTQNTRLTCRISTLNIIGQIIRITNKDTLKPVKLKDLINRYSIKMDSLDKVRIRLNKNSKVRTQIVNDSISRVENNYYKLMDEKNKEIYNYIRTHDKNDENLEGILNLIVDRKFSIALVNDMFKKFPLTVRNSKLGKVLAIKIAERENAETISSYNLNLLNVKFESQTGKMISLKEVKSDIILLDFWASWCAPCRYENRFFIAEKKRLDSNANLSIIGVSLDTKKEKWLKALSVDQFPYLSICDFKGFESLICKEFRVQKIPSNVIINKKGRVLAVNLWDEKVLNFVKKLSNN